ncbi:MAG: hypothetical protein JSV75_06075, partial [Candidatus Bathyarchaeota archaeon]
NDSLFLNRHLKKNHETEKADTSFSDEVKEKKKRKALDGRPKKRRKTKIAMYAYIFLLMLCPTIASSLISYSATIVITPVKGSMSLYVNTDDMTRTGWKRFGANPHLDAIDYDANYLSVKSTNKEAGDFGFIDSGKSTEIIENVTVQLYSKQNQTGDNLEVVVWNGSNWASLGLREISTSWNWVNWTATTQLDSWTKIDGAKIYFVSHRQPGVNTFLVDSARLQVVYSSEP